MNNSEPIYITKPTLNSLSEYTALLEKIWETRQLTNTGPLSRQLESALSEFLSTPHVLLVTNGTLAIHVAIQALDLKDCEIITTPFTWISTATSILWEQCTPVFVDIDPKTFNIDPLAIEAAITPKTKAILAVHVFSNPCDVQQIDAIAKRHNLRVIYDAAHAFGVNVAEKSIFDFGDLSTTSFHATKIFNTAEGGAVFCANEDLYYKVRSVRDFGFSLKRELVRLGTNAKMSEIHAALGLVNLPLFEESKRARIIRTNSYKDILQDRVVYQQYDPDAYNYAYMPVVFQDEGTLLKVVEGLNAMNVFPRRYFYPSLSEIDVLFDKPNTPLSESLSKRILCLPLYPDLALEDVDRIAREVLTHLT